MPDLGRFLRLSCLFLALLPAAQGERLTIDAQQRDQLRRETRTAIDLITTYHYRQKSFADVDPGDLLDKFFRDLDVNRIFLLREDIDFLKERFQANLKPTFLFVGDLYPALEIYNTYQDRVEARLTWIAERLKGDFDLASHRSFTPDRTEAAWPADAAEADQLWENRLLFEIVSEMLEGESLGEARRQVATRYERMRKYLGEIDVRNVQEIFLTSLAQLYDPHSNFFSWDSAQEFDIAISNSLIGIGAQLREIDGQCVIERLIPGSPAEVSGKLHPGDKIVAVAQGDEDFVNIEGIKLRRIVQMIRGEEGSTVRLNVRPASDSGNIKTVALVRDKVELTANLASATLHEVPVGDRSVAMGVIQLPSFYGQGEFGEGSTSTTRDVDELIRKLEALGIEGLVLDLRNNGGGRLDEAVALTGLFIKEGPVVLKRDYRGRIEEDWDRDSRVAYDGPLVVLVSKTSASASEIVAGALQSYGRALIVGDPSTHGKGSVQMPIDLQDAMRRSSLSGPKDVGTVKVTVQKYYLPNGASTQNRGVVADIPLPSASTFAVEGEAELENALSWDTVPASSFKMPIAGTIAHVTPDLRAWLSERSLQRQSDLPEFKFLARSIDWLRQRHDEKDFSLNLVDREAQRANERTFRDEVDAELDHLSADLKRPVPVDLDLTAAREKVHQAKLAEVLLPNGANRSNRFYQKVFYYEDPETKTIEEIWVEYLDYERAIRHADALAEAINQALKVDSKAPEGQSPDAASEDHPSVSSEQIVAVLNKLRILDRGSDFSPVAAFTAILGDSLPPEKLDDALSAFYKRFVEVMPTSRERAPRLDIPLRESLRVLADWLEVRDEGDASRAVAAKKDPPEESAASRTEAIR